MQIGIITVNGMQVGTVSLKDGGFDLETFEPNLDGYVPEGRAAERQLGGPHHHYPHHGGGSPTPSEHSHVHRPGHHAHPSHHYEPGGGYMPPASSGHPVQRGSEGTDQAIRDAAHAHNLDVNTMRSIASIESSMNPSSNANRSPQYKGLYQIGRDEWRRFGEGNIYSARDNAMAAARMFSANRAQFREHYGRDPTDTELYLMHQQGLGFYTRGAMTNIGGNPYPGMHGPQSHESFEAGWGRELARRKGQFSGAADEARPATSPKAVQSPSGEPAAFIMHHTGGGKTPEDIQNTLSQRGLGVQYIMDREGNIVETGGHAHMLPGWGKGEGLSNKNTVGMEVIAKDNSDVTPQQVEAARKFIAKNYANTPVFGHGEVNPGHKEADEGMKIVNAIRADRARGPVTFDPETMAP